MNTTAPKHTPWKREGWDPQVPAKAVTKLDDGTLITVHVEPRDACRPEIVVTIWPPDDSAPVVVTRPEKNKLAASLGAFDETNPVIAEVIDDSVHTIVEDEVHKTLIHWEWKLQQTVELGFLSYRRNGFGIIDTDADVRLTGDSKGLTIRLDKTETVELPFGHYHNVPATFGKADKLFNEWRKRRNV